MGEIVLKRANVVKRVDSEDKAKALEARGFARTDGKTVQASAAKDNNTSKLEKELADAREELQGAKKEIQSLKTELEGTKEQLEAATKKNRAAEKK